MAQIKKIVKPGDLIRGAKVGVAGLDKDGNVVGTGIDTEDIATFPEGAQSGDVLAWGGETGAEWRPHYPESGSEGDVLTLGETGPEWAPPAGGGDMYCHHVYIGSDSGNCLSAKIINSSSEAFSFDSFKSYIAANFAPSSIYDLTKKLNCNGTIKVSSSVPNTDLVVAINATYGSPNSFKYFGSSLSISDGKIMSSSTAGIVNWTIFTSSTFTDTVTAI